MSKHRVIVLSVVNNQLTVTEAAARYGLSRQRIYQLLSRYREGGIEAVEPRSHRPKSNPRATSALVRERIVELRLELMQSGLDAGPISIASHLELEGHRPPSTSTIRRILHAENLITPEPKKRPKSSLRRFEADQPNETWQSDFTHWRLANNVDIEILNWLDDHSRYLLGCTAHQPVTGTIALNEFTRVINEYGPPASTLTDNGLVYTARFRGGKNAFEYLLATLGIKQKNGSPGHPQTQGKIERFHQTLKKWLTAQPRAQTVEELQQQLDNFRDIYNNQRPPPRPSRRHPRHRLHRHNQSHTRRSSHRRSLPDSLRHRRPIRQTHPAPSRQTPPPRNRQNPRPQTSTDHRRPHHRHRHRPPNRRNILRTRHRPRPQLLAQQTKKPRPLAGTNSVNNHATHLTSITRLITRRRMRDSNPRGLSPNTLSKRAH